MVRASLAALMLGAPLIGAGSGSATAGQPPRHAAVKVHTVIIDSLRYQPQVIIVRRGERIRWVNQDPFAHTVTALGGSFDSHSIPPGGSWTYAPAKAGEYAYGCTFHPTMKGKLEVR